MKIHRFIGDFDLSQEEVKIFDSEFLNQTRNVLKLKKGEQIILGDGKLNEATVEIKELDKEFLSGKVLKKEKNQNEPETYSVLYCSILKRENFELVVQKVVEVGIKEISPIITKRTVKLNLRADRLDKIIKEAAEQSGRGIVPVLREPVSFEKAVEGARQNNMNLFFDKSGTGLKNLKFERPKTCGVWVGSEGGWDENELELAKENNFKIISLGKLTLRAETAAIITSFLANNL